MNVSVPLGFLLLAIIFGIVVSQIGICCAAGKRDFPDGTGYALIGGIILFIGGGLVSVGWAWGNEQFAWKTIHWIATGTAILWVAQASWSMYLASPPYSERQTWMAVLTHSIMLAASSLAVGHYIL